MILNDFLELFLATSCDRNTPTDKSKSPVTFDDMVELYNQLSIYIGKAEFKPKVWKNRRKYEKTDCWISTGPGRHAAATQQWNRATLDTST